MKFKNYKRIFTIVLDSVGIGEATDADNFNDVGADTLGHIGNMYNGNLKIPNLIRLGLGNIREDNKIKNILPVNNPLADFGKMHEISSEKDSMNGHWEMMGLPLNSPLATFPNGFPNDLIKKIENFSHRKVIVNKPYSGTDVIHDYGEYQLKTGDLIIYTSGDSVLQIAANINVIPLNELYKICEYVRNITIDYHIGRIIARPYNGKNKKEFIRTSDRRDYTLKPISKTDLDILKDSGYDVLAIGKINDIFSGQGITKGIHTVSNHDGMIKTMECQQNNFTGFCFTNLVDFDAKYGHRRNIQGFGDCLIEFDSQLGSFINKMKTDDLLIITADHGNDPGFRGTDHTREYTPLLVYSPSMNENGHSLGIRNTYADLGATVLDNFYLKSVYKKANSFLNII